MLSILLLSHINILLFHDEWYADVVCSCCNCNLLWLSIRIKDKIGNIYDQCRYNFRDDLNGSVKRTVQVTINDSR